ncbi:MAG TPA: enterotoxin [Candidatus Aquilonibacter sp.]|nr:enterotoxin [Candidatus Aquilonibacter sp.]
MIIVLFVTAAGTCGKIAAQEPGTAIASVGRQRGEIGNRVVRLTWSVSGGHLGDVVFVDELHHTVVPLSTPFAVLLRDGEIDRPETLRLDGGAQELALTADPNASRASDRVPGKEVDVKLTSRDGAAEFVWSVILRDESRYIRQRLTIAAAGQDLPIQRVELVDVRLPEAHVVGEVKGSPIVAGNLYLGFEHPLSSSDVTAGRATAWIDRELPLRAGRSVQYSSVIGVVRAGQLRRDFLEYIERERAHPYRTFLHYNSWYDLGYFTPYDEAGALDRIHAFGQELHVKRGVTLNSFLFDDGWDDHNSLWQFNSGFPDGFMKVRAAAETYGADPGVWMSPWGGYGKPKQERLAYGRSAGFEIVSKGFALSGPKYYDRFRDVCLEMIRKYGVNQFKFDGTGNADSVFPGSAFDSDFDAAIHLIGELRQVKPDIYINLTTGTRPSPFWLFYADSIWRGGEDDSTAGVGPYRERWITYRDADTYARIVKEGPLYPLNSLMLHGMIYARYHRELNKDPDNDFRNEIRSYFGTGTQLQEMYITPSLLSRQNWDDLAEAAKWSRANADVLKDTHWIGGDPAWLEVYGWASWAPREGILVLRNPSDQPQSIRVDLAKAFELPDGAAQRYVASSPWKDDAGKPALHLRAGTPHAFDLAPFQVLTLDMKPEAR